MNRRLLQSYIDGETDALISDRVRAHARQCHHCDADLSAYQRIRNALACLKPPDEAAVARVRDFAESLLRRGRDTPDAQMSE